MVQDEADVSLRVGPRPASSLVFRRLLTYRHILVAAPDDLAGAAALEEPAGINDYAGVIRAAVAGMGVAKIPSIVCQRELSAGHLVPVLVDWRLEEVDLPGYYLSRRHPSRIVERFLGHCVAQAEEIARATVSPVEPRRRPGRTPRIRAR